VTRERLDALWAAVHEAQRAVDEARREAYKALGDDYVTVAEWADRATVMLAEMGQLLEKEREED
jgi:hypothetical protein